MTKKEKLLFLIEEYEKGNYETNTFCDQFVEIFFHETDNSITEYENKFLKKVHMCFHDFRPLKRI